jgi:hypothetical protein
MLRKIPTHPTATVALKRATAAFVEADVSRLVKTRAAQII